MRCLGSRLLPAGQRRHKLATFLTMTLSPGTREDRPVMRSWNALLVFVVGVGGAPAYAQPAGDPPGRAGTDVYAITQANADASAGTVNVTPTGRRCWDPGSRHFAGFRAFRDRLSPGSRRRSSASLNARTAWRKPTPTFPTRCSCRPRTMRKACPTGGRTARPEHHAPATDPVRWHHGFRRATRVHRPRADGIQPVQLVGEPAGNTGRHGGREARR